MKKSRFKYFLAGSLADNADVLELAKRRARSLNGAAPVKQPVPGGYWIYLWPDIRTSSPLPAHKSPGGDH